MTGRQCFLAPTPSIVGQQFFELPLAFGLDPRLQHVELQISAFHALNPVPQRGRALGQCRNRN